jgi:hypothetical protein
MSASISHVIDEPSARSRPLLGRFTTQTLVWEYTATAPRIIPADPVHIEDEWLPADPATILRYFSAQSDARLKTRFLDFLGSGSMGIIVIRHGQWIAYGWASRPGRSRPPHMPRSAAHLGAYWFFYFHTRQDLRGQGILKLLIPRTTQYIFSEDQHPLILSDTLPENIAPQRGLLASGFHPKGIYTIHGIAIRGIGQLPLSGSWNPDTLHPSH